MIQALLPAGRVAGSVWVRCQAPAAARGALPGLRWLSAAQSRARPEGPPPSPWDDTNTGVVGLFPRAMQPYVRLVRFDRPIGSALLFLPCAWGISLATAAGELPPAPLLALFAAGSVVMRGAGCTVNDLWDRKYDQQVARTRTRPLASGDVSPRSAVAFLGAQLAVGLGILLQLNPYSIVLGAASLAPVAVYPLMKRVMDWPQAILGLTFNWGAMVGYSAVAGSCDWATVLPLYTAGVAWTLHYDTIYGHQDKKDDAALGLRSTSLLFGEQTKPWLAAFSAATVASLGIAGWNEGLAAPFYIALALGGGHLAAQIRTVDLDNPKSCLETFKANQTFGMLIWAGIVGGNAVL